MSALTYAETYMRHAGQDYHLVANRVAKAADELTQLACAIKAEMPSSHIIRSVTNDVGELATRLEAVLAEWGPVESKP